MVLAPGVVERLRPEPGHRIGEDVLGRVPDELAGFGAARGEELERTGGRERLAKVDPAPSELRANRILGEPGTDGMGDVERRRATRHSALGAVRKGQNDGHGILCQLRSVGDVEYLVGAPGLEPGTSTV